MRRLALVPQPVEVLEQAGQFELRPGAAIRCPPEILATGRVLAAYLRPATGFELPVAAGPAAAGDIVLGLAAGGRGTAEGYELEVTPTTVRLTGDSGKGLFWGLQTLRQLLPPAIYRAAPMPGPWVLPAVRIKDQPRFRWRGMHLDCSRHFLPKEFVKKFIDLLALHKLNTLHWHLTDDQGWRLEIRRYPRLAEVAAWRDQTMLGHHNNQPRRFDNTRHGGFYTQEDVREIVAYAAQRHIVIVPEIEMPGHSQAVLAAYPELGCTGGPYQVRQVWAISEDVLCAGNEKVFAFIEDVLDEVLELFPGEFIHVGGDECLKPRWQACPRCQARIAAEGLKDEHELQSYFIRRVERFLNSRGRRLIGWDEILEGGLAPNASVMSWRGIEGGVKAAQAGHDVVFATNQFTYFDHYQSADPWREPLAIGGCLPLAKAYSHEPVPATFTPEQAAHVLGAQGQLWTEYLADPKQVEYMAFPRLTALAEVAWTPAARKDYGDYLARLAAHLRRLDALDVNYRPLDRE